jgi:hypothetical protein
MEPIVSILYKNWEEKKAKSHTCKRSLTIQCENNIDPQSNSSATQIRSTTYSTDSTGEMLWPMLVDFPSVHF